MNKWLLAACLLLACTSNAQAQTPQAATDPLEEWSKQSIARFSDINTVHDAFMHSTFMLTGPGSSGTAFVLANPCPKRPNVGIYVLITADHVLRGISGDKILLLGRTKAGSKWQLVPLSVTIRSDGKDLWTRSPRADVAAMYIRLPPFPERALLPVSELANDDTIKKYGIGPGDQVFSIGYPFSKPSSKEGNFPYLRSGHIASYPLVPSSELVTFAIDQRVFPGNSGGPVYFHSMNKVVNQSPVLGTMFAILGLLSEDVVYEDKAEANYETTTRRHSLGLGVVVHASLIKETISKMPVHRDCL